MDVTVTWGTGRAETKTGAFDKALYEAGLANYNLVEMSSIIPEGARVSVEQLDTDTNRFGDKAYVVLARTIEEQEDREAWAGLGWHYHTEERKGVFVECEGGTEEGVEQRIQDAVDTLHNERMDEETELNMKTVGIESDGRPACAVVAALYEIEAW